MADTLWQFDAQCVYSGNTIMLQFVRDAQMALRSIRCILGTHVGQVAATGPNLAVDETDNGRVSAGDRRSSWRFPGKERFGPYVMRMPEHWSPVITRIFIYIYIYVLHKWCVQTINTTRWEFSSRFAYGRRVCSSAHVRRRLLIKILRARRIPAKIEFFFSSLQYTYVLRMLIFL